jgi:adenosylhomocysteine nucleosidase
MRILITFAVDAEFAPWRRLRRLERRTVEGLEIFRAPIGRATVDFVVTGMGMDNARRGAEVAMREPYTHCIAAGFAGALDPGLRVGDVLAARAVQYFGRPKTLTASRNLWTSAWENRAHEAKMLLTVPNVITTAEEKQRLRPFADAVDMESFAVLDVAAGQNLSSVAIRVITDRFDEQLPPNLADAVDERGRVRVVQLVKHVAARPFELRGLIRLGRNSRAAAQALANFLETFVKNLSFRQHGWPPPELQEVASR